MNRYLAEAFGTFCLIFAGTGAVVVDSATYSQVAGSGAITHVGIALTFGLIVMVMIYTIGDISGAHINPAVSIGFACAGRFPIKEVPPYIVAQLAGAFAASGLLWFLFPDASTYGETLPRGDQTGFSIIRQSFLLEVVLTTILMFVILAVSTGAKEKGITAAIAIGGLIGLEAMFAGPICGASMNPARSLAPAIVAGKLQGLWIYLTAPVVGACLAVPLCKVIHHENCCAKPDDSPSE